MHLDLCVNQARETSAALHGAQISGMFQKQFGELIGLLIVHLLVDDQKIGYRSHWDILVDTLVWALGNIGDEI